MLNPNGEGKLSKRSVGFDASGKRVPVLVHEYQELGYLPEATMNFLTNIGWTFGDGIELFEPEEAIKRFDDPEYDDAFNSGYEDALQEIPRCPAGSTEKYKAGYEEGYTDGERDLMSGAVMEADEDEDTENRIADLA